jgi:DnaJ family protein A protein 1
MKDGENIRFAGEGDQEPGLEAGDIVIVLDEKSHDVYKRRDLDLVMTMQLDLVESLCGFHRTVTTLDKRTLVITTIPGKGTGDAASHFSFSLLFVKVILLVII